MSCTFYIVIVVVVVVVNIVNVVRVVVFLVFMSNPITVQFRLCYLLISNNKEYLTNPNFSNSGEYEYQKAKLIVLLIDKYNNGVGKSRKIGIKVNSNIDFFYKK